MLGIGIVTYNRIETLKQCVAAVRRHTRGPFRLFVADDGSTDGTPAWLASEGICYATGSNGGAGRNKNRAIGHFLDRRECDPVLLLEDDCHPAADGWEWDWADAAARWGHVNALPWGWTPETAGDGTPASPWHCPGFGGQCTVTTRADLLRVGYIDPRFVGYGYEHVEWTWRFARLHGAGAGGDGLWAPFGPSAVPALWRGLRMVDAGSYHDQASLERNAALWGPLSQEPIWRSRGRE